MVEELIETKIKIDLGCGTNKKAGFIGVDNIAFDGVDVVHDIANDKWPWGDGSVDEVHASHFVEHLTADQRIFFCNELYRVLKKGVYVNGQATEGFATIITPHWASQRAYGDMTHQWPPVSEFWFYYLSREWRLAGNSPHLDIKFNHKGYDCDFEARWGYNIRPDLLSRNQEYQNYAMANFKDAITDTIATLIKK